MSSYSPEQLARLKSLIHDYMDKNQVFDRVRDALESQAISEALSSQKILEALGQQGVLADVVDQVGNARLEPEAAAEPNKRYLLLKLQYGKAFLDFAAEIDSPTTLQIHISFLRQRFSSRKVQCTVDPVFDESFLLSFSAPDGSNVELATLVKLQAPIHIVVVKEQGGSREVLAVKAVDWRLFLSVATLQFPVEMMGIGARAKFAVGILYFQVDMLPKPTSAQLLPDRLITEQLSLEQKYTRDITHSFFEYTTEWWRDYKQIRPSHNTRLVKIFAETEDGSQQPVCALVQPLKCNRMLDSPLHAARFVSLIPQERVEVPGGARVETWYSMHTFLSKGAGDTEDHAVLLCSFLLGFGLDAYVCLGASGEGSHAWVMTRGRKIQLWETINGQRMPSDDPRVHRFYRKIGCVFNHRKFYGNIQVDDTVANVSWELENEAMWKPMAPEMISSLTPAPRFLPLRPPASGVYEMAEKLESELKQSIQQHRNHLDLLTFWDDELGYLLTPALANYELERIGSVTFGSEEFQDSIHNYVPDGHTFKAYPYQFSHMDAGRMLTSLVQSQVARDILETRGDTVRLVVRVKVVAYPEETFVAWVMLAVRYRAIKI